MMRKRRNNKVGDGQPHYAYEYTDSTETLLQYLKPYYR